MDNPGYNPNPEDQEQDPKTKSINDLNSSRGVDPVGVGVKLLELLRGMTIEPIIFLHLSVLLMTFLCADDLIIDRACRVNLNYSRTICNALQSRQIGNYTEEETEVQKVMSVVATWRSVLEYSLPCILVFFLGSRSDELGLKFLLVLPQIGAVVKVGGILLCCYLERLDANFLTLVFTIPSAVTGSFPLFSMAYHSYIGGWSSEEERTARFGIANVFRMFGSSLGSAAGGFLLTQTKLGHAGVFQIGAAVEVCVVVYTLFFVRNRTKVVESFSGAGSFKESPPPADQTEQQQTAVHQHVGQKFLASLRRFWTPFSDLLRPKTRRPKLLLLILCNFLASSPYLGEQVVLYLFKRYQVGWSAGDYGLFSMVKALAQMFGTFFAMGFLSAWLRVSDPLLGSIASMSQLGSRFIYAFATTNVLMYCGAGVDILNGVMSAVARSMGSKMVSAEEQGSLHSLFAISDTVDTILSNLVYGTVYRATLEVLPGAFFLLSAADTIPPFGIFLYFMYASRHLVPRTD